MLFSYTSQQNHKLYPSYILSPWTVIGIFFFSILYHHPIVSLSSHYSSPHFLSSLSNSSFFLSVLEFLYEQVSAWIQVCLCASTIECRYSLLPSKYSHSSFHFIFPSKRVYLCRYYALFLYGSLLLFPVCCQLLLFLHSFMFPFTFLSLSFLIAFPLYFSPFHSLPQCLPFLVVFPCLPFTSLSCYLFSQVLPFILNPPLLQSNF